MQEPETLETPDGPFRTPEPTAEARLEKARHASWARVERITTEAMETERERARTLDRVAWLGLGLSILALGTVIALVAVGGPSQWPAFLCPAAALALSAAFGVGYRRRIARAARSRRVS